MISLAENLHFKKEISDDFVNLNDVVTDGKTTAYPNGTKVGKLPDGRKVNVRTKSSDGCPTLEIQGTGKTA